MILNFSLIFWCFDDSFLQFTLCRTSVLYSVLIMILIEYYYTLFSLAFVRWHCLKCFVCFYLLVFFGMTDDGRNISSSFRAELSSSSYGSNTCWLCCIWSLVIKLPSFLHLISLGWFNVISIVIKLKCLPDYQFLIEALQFTPRLKAVLSRILPLLGNVRDMHRAIFANGMAIFFHLSLTYEVTFQEPLVFESFDISCHIAYADLDGILSNY